MARLVGGDGQDTSTVPALPGATDVLVELRVDPAPPGGAFDIIKGVAVDTRGGVPPSAGGLLVQAAYRGDGWYEVRLQPIDEGTDSSTYTLALLGETRNSKGVKADTNYKVYIDASYVINGLHLRSKHYSDGGNGDLWRPILEEAERERERATDWDGRGLSP